MTMLLTHLLFRTNAIHITTLSQSAPLNSPFDQDTEGYIGLKLPGATNTEEGYTAIYFKVKSR